MDSGYHGVDENVTSASNKSNFCRAASLGISLYKPCTVMHNIRSGSAPCYLFDTVQPTSAKNTLWSVLYFAETTSYGTLAYNFWRTGVFFFSVQRFGTLFLQTYASSRIMLIFKKTVENSFLFIGF